MAYWFEYRRTCFGYFLIWTRIGTGTSMASSTVSVSTQRRTTADEIFDQLQADIVAMRLPPGTKVSESEVAKQHGVSRQPVREAFIQLNNLGLLQVRPQKATLVRKISIQGILNARFIRTAVEIEVMRDACKSATEKDFSQFNINLKARKRQRVMMTQRSSICWIMIFIN